MHAMPCIVKRDRLGSTITDKYKSLSLICPGQMSCGNSLVDVLTDQKADGLRTQHRSWIHICADVIEADKAHKQCKCKSKGHCEKSARPDSIKYQVTSWCAGHNGR